MAAIRGLYSPELGSRRAQVLEREQCRGQLQTDLGEFSFRAPKILWGTCGGALRTAEAALLKAPHCAFVTRITLKKSVPKHSSGLQVTAKASTVASPGPRRPSSFLSLSEKLTLPSQSSYLNPMAETVWRRPTVWLTSTNTSTLSPPCMSPRP